MLFRWSEVKFDNTHDSVRACADWMCEHVLEGCRPYLIVFMFKPLNGSQEAVVAQMKRAIERDFFSSLCKRFSRHPNQPSQQAKLPMLWLFPDLPVWKRDKKTPVQDMEFNCNGLHYNGVLLLPPKSRFKSDIIKHIEGYQDVYVRWPIERIHVTEIHPGDLNYVGAYAGKTMNNSRFSQDDIIILPENRAANSNVRLSEEERAIRDIQAKSNVSDETAGQMWIIENCKKESRK